LSIFSQPLVSFKSTQFPVHVCTLAVDCDVELRIHCAAERLKLTNKAVTEALDGLPAHKLHCSVLAEEAIRTALKDYYDKNGIPYDPAQFPDEDSCAHCEKAE